MRWTSSRLIIGIALWNGALLHAKNRFACPSVQHKEIAGFVALDDHRDSHTVATQGDKDGLGRRVVIPKVVMNKLKPPHQLTGLRRQCYHGVCPFIVTRSHRSVVVGAGTAGRYKNETGPC